MNESISVTPDFTACKYISDLYREMRTRMEWDDDYGENLSALGDDFTIIRPLHFRNIPHGQDQPFTEYVEKICAIFQRAQRQSLLTVSIRYTDPDDSNAVPSV